MRLALSLCFLLGCTSTEAGPEIQSLVPNIVESDSATLVHILGSRYDTSLVSNIETGETTQNTDFDLVLSRGGAADIVLSEVEYVDEVTLQTTIPPGTPAGIYDAQVLSPTGASLRLAEALTILSDPTDSPFGEATPISEVNSTNFPDTDPSATDDLLELYFASRRTGSLGTHDIWVAKRASKDDVWDEPVRASGLNSNNSDWGPEVSRDGLSILISSGRGGAIDIYRSTRTSRSDAWSTPAQIDELASPEKDSSAAMSDSELYIAFDSNRAGGPPANLYIADRLTASDLWNTPTRMDISSAGDDWCPHFAQGGLEIMFASDRSSPGNAGHDIYLAVRPDLQSPFAAPTLVTELNSTSHDACPWMSSDRRTVFFVSDRDGSHGIYQATR